MLQAICDLTVIVLKFIAEDGKFITKQEFREVIFVIIQILPFSTLLTFTFWAFETSDEYKLWILLVIIVIVHMIKTIKSKLLNVFVNVLNVHLKKAWAIFATYFPNTLTNPKATWTILHVTSCLWTPQFHVIASYPRVWNMPQSWQCEIEVYKATYHFIYAQKNFFTGNVSLLPVSYCELKSSVWPPSVVICRSDPGLGQRQWTGHLLICSIFMEV